MSQHKLRGWLASNPKLLHVLFVSLIVLSQVGFVVASDTGNQGP